MNTRTKVISLYGGPSVGKSETASLVFSLLKQKGISCELINEAAKDVVWEESYKLLENQLHLFSEQFRRQWRLIDKVDYIITDSPLLLNAVYYDDVLSRSRENIKFSDDYIRLTKEFFNESYFQFNNISFYLERKMKWEIDGYISYPGFEETGRIHNLKESLSLDEKIRIVLKNLDPNYISLYPDETQHVGYKIVDIILKG